MDDDTVLIVVIVRIELRDEVEVLTVATVRGVFIDDVLESLYIDDNEIIDELEYVFMVIDVLDDDEVELDDYDEMVAAVVYEVIADIEYDEIDEYENAVVYLEQTDGIRDDDELELMVIQVICQQDDDVGDADDDELDEVVEAEVLNDEMRLIIDDDEVEVRVHPAVLTENDVNE